MISACWWGRRLAVAIPDVVGDQPFVAWRSPVNGEVLAAVAERTTAGSGGEADFVGAAFEGPARTRELDVVCGDRELRSERGEEPLGPLPDAFATNVGRLVGGHLDGVGVEAARPGVRVA